MLQNSRYAEGRARLLCESENIIPHVWYQTIHSIGEKSDLVVITVLTEIIYWQRYSSSKINKNWEVSYQYFEQKFGFTRKRVKEAFIYLESLDLIYRRFNQGNASLNIFYVTLNINKITDTSILDINLQTPCSAVKIGVNIVSQEYSTSHQTSNIQH